MVAHSVSSETFVEDKSCKKDNLSSCSHNWKNLCEKEKFYWAKAYVLETITKEVRLLALM
jgi:hypothetical protein